MAQSKKLIINAHEDEVEKKYRFGRTLGEGTFATVKLVTSLSDGSKWAVKIIKRSALTSEDEESLRTEIQILQLTNHPNIVSVREVFYCRQYVYLVMELMTGGELFDRIVTKDHYSEQEAKQALAQIVTAIKYCHDQNIVHRDLKPENILYQGPDDSSPLKLADFGLAALLKPNQLMTVACGTPGYVAPEILRGIAYGKEVDIWSIGVILYILLCGFPPFYDDNNKKLFAQIVSANYSFPDPYWTNISTSAKSLVTQLLVINPQERLTAQEILDHPWMNEDGTLMSLDHFKPNLKSYNARRRFRSAIRAVQITQLLRNLAKQHSSEVIKTPIDAAPAGPSSTNVDNSAKPVKNTSETTNQGETSGEDESDIDPDSSLQRKPPQDSAHSQLEKISEGTEHTTVGITQQSATTAPSVPSDHSSHATTTGSVASQHQPRPTSTANSHHTSSNNQHNTQHAKPHHHKTPASTRRKSK